MKIDKDITKKFQYAIHDLQFAAINMRFEIIVRNHYCELDELREKIRKRIHKIQSGLQ